MRFLEDLGISILKTGFNLWSKTRLPKLEGSIKLPGITNNVEVIRDKWGIPHIYAKRMCDLFFAQGFVHAQDRLWQMELIRRVSRGKLSEFIGKDALIIDRLSRTLGFERVAHQDLKLYSEDKKNLVQQYCDGVNAFINHKDYKAPIEFSLTKLKASNWQIIDVLSISRLLNAQMTWGWYDELVRAKLLTSIGTEALSELDNTYQQSTICLTDGIELNPQNVDEKFKANNPYMKGISGSNAWTISGKKTNTGQPFLCNDPHLAISNPNIWYEIHLDCPDFKVTGVSIPGLPLVPIGHNEQIGWGITLAFTDLEDLVIEKFTDSTFQKYLYKEQELPTEIIEEKIIVKGEAQPYVEKVLITRHGVIVSDVIGHSEHHLALQSMALKPNEALWGWYSINTARNWEDFKQGVTYLDSPGLNIVYADIVGNIGYYNSGKMPIKTKYQSSFPMPGWTGEGDWVAFIPFDQMPHALNPEKEFIVTCNNKIVPDNFPYFMGDIYMNGYRAQRLEHLIKAKEKLDIKDFMAMQMDIQSIPGKVLSKHYESIYFNDQFLDKIKLIFVEWGGILSTTSIGGCLYKVIKQKLVRRLYEKLIPDKELIQDILGRGYHHSLSTSNTFLGHNTSNLLQILDKGETSMCLIQYGGKEKLLKDGFLDAIAYLQKELGENYLNWQWGKLHKMKISHALSVKKPLDKIFSLGPYKMPGDTDTPLQTYPVDANKFDGEIVTASFRQIIDFSNFDNSLCIASGGQSGHLASEFYACEMKDWLAGKYHPMCWSRAQVEKYSQYKLNISPTLST